MRLLHYSNLPIGDIHSSPQPELNDKPKGLWVSVKGEDDWENWCRGENFSLEGLACVHEVKLHSNARILRVSDAWGIEDLTRRYGAERYPELSSLCGRMDAIKWREIAGEYQGVVIAPYIWSKRLAFDSFWYYGWDCASGCIWDADAIQSVSLLEKAA
jgi:hypothetical protein